MFYLSSHQLLIFIYYMNLNFCFEIYYYYLFHFDHLFIYLFATNLKYGEKMLKNK